MKPRDVRRALLVSATATAAVALCVAARAAMDAYGVPAALACGAGAVVAFGGLLVAMGK